MATFVNGVEHIRIGSHHFELYSPLDSKLAGQVRGLTFLGNLADQSPLSQNPTISSNDSVQVLSSEYDYSLQQVIASQNLGEHICAVWHCGKDFVTRDELHRHYASQQCQPDRSRPKALKTVTGVSLLSAKKARSVKTIVVSDQPRGNSRGLKEMLGKVWKPSLKT